MMKNNNSIEYIQKCYIEDYNKWTYLIDKSLRECIDKTNTSVISQLTQINKGNGDGPLAGVPYAVKDLFDVVGFPSKKFFYTSRVQRMWPQKFCYY